MIDLDSLLAEATEEPPCGPDLEYDAAFMALETASHGKPEQQFGDTVIAAEEPLWGGVRTDAIALLGRSKDLRVAVLLVRALVRTEQFAGLLPGLRLVQQLLERYWDGVHPRLDADDNDDPTMRINALAPLVDVDGLLRDLRGCYFVSSRQHGAVLVRDIEIALGKLPPRGVGEPVAQGQIEAILRAVAADDPGVMASVGETIAVVKALSAFLADKVGSERAPDFTPLHAMLHAVQQICQSVAGIGGDAAAEEGGADALASEGSGAPAKPISGEIRSRQDALMMIDKIVSYFERNEPTNPAPLLLKRAKRLVNMSFLDIVKELVPDGMGQIETIAGLGREE